MWHERVLTAAMVAMSASGMSQASADLPARPREASVAAHPVATSTTPYSRLFEATPPVTVNRTAPRLGRAKTVPAPPRVVCGLTLIPGNPAIDRGIAAPTKPGETSFAIRSAEPPMCR